MTEPSFQHLNDTKLEPTSLRRLLFLLLKDGEHLYIEQFQHFYQEALHMVSFDPLVTNGPSYTYHLDESTFILRGTRSNFSILFHFSMKIGSANRIAPDGTPRFAASHLGLFCLPMSHKKDARLI